MGLHPGLPHHAGAQTGWEGRDFLSITHQECNFLIDCRISNPLHYQWLVVYVHFTSLPTPTSNSITSACSLAGAVELVPHLPSCLGLRRHPHPHAGHQDGRSLQARLRPAQRLAGPASARLVHDGHAAQAGLLPDAVRQAGEAGGCQVVLRLHPPVDHVAGRAGGAGPQHFSREEGSVRVRGSHSAAVVSGQIHAFAFCYFVIGPYYLASFQRDRNLEIDPQGRKETIICDLYLNNKRLWVKKL